MCLHRSIGCTVMEMLTCRPPYRDLDPFPAMFKIASEGINVDKLNLSKCSEHARDFLSLCFTRWIISYLIIYTIILEIFKMLKIFVRISDPQNQQYSNQRQI